MADEIEQIFYWDMPDTDMEHDGYDMRDVPALTKENIRYLVDKYNKLIDIVNDLVEQERKRG